MTQEQTAEITARLDALSRQVEWLVEQQRRQGDLFTEMTPILREVMATATAKMDDLEKRGWFAFARELGNVGTRVLDHYTAEDVRALGDGVVKILDTVRAVTQPDVMAIVAEASEALQHPERAEPVGLVGMMKASRQDDVRKGMAVFLELLRHVGRASAQLSTPAKGTTQKDKLAAVLGPKRKNPALGIERAPRKTVVAPAVRPAAAPPPPACAVPAKGPAKVDQVIDGVGFTADGHLADPSQWTRELAESIAHAQGLELDEARWKLIDIARKDFEANRAAANIRRLTQISGVGTKEIYALFPKAPGRTIARIAGTPKPAGCL